MSQHCEKRVKLAADVQDALSDLVECIHREREILKIEGASNTLAAVDEELEKAFGRKERAIGALYLHQDEHHCG